MSRVFRESRQDRPDHTPAGPRNITHDLFSDAIDKLRATPFHSHGMVPDEAFHGKPIVMTTLEEVRETETERQREIDRERETETSRTL